jgi:hypothetical protein
VVELNRSSNNLGELGRKKIAGRKKSFRSAKENGRAPDFQE